MAERKEYVRGGNRGIYVTKDGYLVDRKRANELNRKYKKETYERLTIRVRKDDSKIPDKLNRVT